jgi:hypothetical protein
VISAQGQPVLALGSERVPHGQEVRVADFDATWDGPEMLLRAEGHTPKVHLVSSQTSSIVRTFSLQRSPTNVGMETVYWDGPDQPARLFNGGWLWDVANGRGGPLPELPPPGGSQVHRMGFYHAIAANLCGDDGEELVVYDPTGTEVYVYTRRPLDASRLPRYQHGPRQYNPRLMD